MRVEQRLPSLSSLSNGDKLGVVRRIPHRFDNIAGPLETQYRLSELRLVNPGRASRMRRRRRRAGRRPLSCSLRA
jgi:hypothetical protein